MKNSELSSSNSQFVIPLVCFLLLQGCGSDDESDSEFDLVCRKDAKGTYSEQKDSLYVLPYTIGESYEIGQGNCTFGSHRATIRQQFAYDFVMPTGTSIVAARDGTVVAVVEQHSDETGVPGDENYIVLSHDDGTKSRYIHLTQQGALVELNDTVLQGQAIGISGNSGNSTGPHLHFDVGDGACIPHVDANCRSLPINFLNTSPHSNGLIEGQRYTAEQY